MVPTDIEPAHPVRYPEEDGKPMGETDLHRDEIAALIDMLMDRYREADDVYVAGDLFVYYEEGEPGSCVCPDVFVVRGVPRGPRRIYKLWEEGAAPCFVLEVSSKKTWLEDTGNKKALCARLGVAEYFLFDPEGDYLSPRLQGFRLKGGEYAHIAPGPGGTVTSEELGLVLSPDGPHLRCVDAATGERLLRPQEAREAGRQAAQARAKAERVSRKEQRARRRAERAREEAERARQQAEARAAAAEAELRRLRAERDPDPS